MEQGLEIVRLVIAGSLRPSRGRRSNLYFSDTVLSRTFCMHPSRTSVALVAYYSTTSDGAGTYRTGVLERGAWMYVAHHLEE